LEEPIRWNLIAALTDFVDEGPFVGTGKAFGFEWMVEKQRGKTGGWFNYTLSWAKRQFPLINQGFVFPHEFDGRHQLKLFAFHRLNQQFTLSFNWIYQSGLPRSIQTANQNIFSPPNLEPGIGPKNAIRSKANHRLDIALSYQLKKVRFEQHLKLSIYNVYNRKNVAFHKATIDDDGNVGLTPVHLMPLMPSLQYRIKF